MLQMSAIKRVLILLTVIIGVVFAAPNIFYKNVENYNDSVELSLLSSGSEKMVENSFWWPKFLPSGLINLGLDLRGGAHLLAEVNVEEVYDDRMDSIWPVVRAALRAERDKVGTIRRVATSVGTLRIKISNKDALEVAKNIILGVSQPVSSMNLPGSRDITVSSVNDELIVEFSESEKLAMNDRTMKQSLEIIRRRVDEVGTREPTIQRQGERRILIQVPGIGSADELKSLIGTTARLTFQEVVRRASSSNEVPGSGNVLYPSYSKNDDGSFYVLKKASVVAGEDLIDAQPGFDQNGSPSVNFRFNPPGAKKFGIFTSNNIGSPFAIVLDSEVISAPVIRDAIMGGSGQISGNFSMEESTELSVLLRAGALPAGMTFLEERTIGPELGQDSIDAGKIACIIAFLLILVFMFLSYGLFGIFANIALIINVVLIFALLSIVGATLTLPGIAGIVLTIGMAVDANVLVFERIREELKTSKGPARAIELGYEKALSAIFDANITTFITAVFLFSIGSGPIRGFSITLGLGILTSVFSAIYVTRLIIIMWFETARPKKIEV
jgi:preprotein translocase subunit SecD